MFFGRYSFSTKVDRRLSMNQEKIIVIDFGGQYNQLVAAVSASAAYTVKFILIKQIWNRSRP